MKRYIKSNYESSKYQNPVKDNPSIQRAFDRLWKDSGENVEAFMRGLDAGIGNGDLPRALLDWDYYSSDLMEVAEQYAQYREANKGMKRKRRTYGTKRADSLVTELVNSIATIPISVELTNTRKYPDSDDRTLVYIISADPHYTASLVSMYSDTISIDISPDSTFELDDKMIEDITRSIKYVEGNYKTYSWFVQKYSRLVDTFLGEYLSVPESDYIRYICATKNMNTGKREVTFTKDKYGSGARPIAEILYNNGYIDKVAVAVAYDFLFPLFESYGLELQLVSNYYLRVRL